MRHFIVRFLALASIPMLAACAAPEPLTEQRAASLVQAKMFRIEPVYAEVPQRVAWGPESPKDDYDELAVRTLRNLERAGLVTVETTEEEAGTVVHASQVTPKGFQLLGTVPSARGPAWRGKIAERVYDGVRNFVRHPSIPTTGRIEVVWHYDNPTPLYPLFETKIDKPLHAPFMSVVSIYWDQGDWNLRMLVRKEKA